ncbi:isochorismate synthase [Flavobacterium zepuense]|uniref:isochorismate synthase n=1 Tax=Flavobacterium zepuense TaxID=2593302 RepID=A0A552UT79_9FLAO|nr:isochorismate synthase [Flavobacterium zepuense]TRW21429.1 isochorismate synthase [Flavobacterium zepuense]
MTHLFSRLKEQLQTGFPFAVYSKPGSTIINGVFQNDSSIHAVNYNGSGFVFAPFALGKTVFIPAHAADIISAEMDLDVNIPDAPLQPAIDVNAKSHFEKLVVQSVAAIKSGAFQKLVLSRKELVHLAEADVVAIFQKLLVTYPNAFRYCFYDPQAGLWMGATPEQLLKVENHTLHTVALAGTQLYKAGEEAVWEEKERQEQKFVTDYIVSELADYTANVDTTEPYTFRAGNIVHIKTDISAELKDVDSLYAVINTLHPTPAVCGLPKSNAKEYLLANEDYDREYYAGFLGELNHDFAIGQPKTDLFVNLRCMKIQDDTAHLYIGCGITTDSDPQKEFLETVNKSMTMRKVI